MNTQGAFTKMVQHLRKQGCQALGKDGRCAYRTEDGLMCPVGCLIPDKLYFPGMDDKDDSTDIQSLVYDYSEVKDFFTGVDISMLTAVQIVHDKYPINQWEERFTALAEEFELQIPEK